VPAYDDTLGGVRNGRGIPSQTFVDAQIALDLGELADGDTLFGGVKLVAGASNLFDQQPHFAEVSGLAGYDMSQGDLKGRFWYLRLGKAF
jgi:outer membrane receptor protein involved in Fe transport